MLLGAFNEINAKGHQMTLCYQGFCVNKVCVNLTKQNVCTLFVLSRASSIKIDI